MTHTTLERVRYPDIGDMVYTLDREELGRVKEISGTFFKVNVRWGRDYWLSCDYIGQSTPGDVQLVLVKNQIADYKMSRPAEAQEPMLDGTVDSLISDAEMEDQRRRMEAELAEQRSHN